MWTNEPGTRVLRHPWRSSFPMCRGPHTSSPCLQKSSGRSRGQTQFEPDQKGSAQRRSHQWGRRLPLAPWLRLWPPRGRGSARLALFHRLPSQALRTQLGEVQPGDPRTLAVRADRLWSVHSTKAAGTVAVADGQEDLPAASIAAVRGAGGRGRGGRSRGRGAARGAAKAPAATAAPTSVTAAEPTPSDLA
jgi:hypothetical protein